MQLNYWFSNSISIFFQSHNFGPGEAITIDLQAEIKFDDYVLLTKFMKSKDESDKYLHRIDEIMSNFIHVVDHSSSRFDFVETIVNFPAFYSLKVESNYKHKQILAM